MAKATCCARGAGAGLHRDGPAVFRVATPQPLRLGCLSCGNPLQAPVQLKAVGWGRGWACLECLPVHVGVCVLGVVALVGQWGMRCHVWAPGQWHVALI